MAHDFGTLSQKDLLCVGKLTSDDVQTIFSTASRLKADRHGFVDHAPHRKVAMIFEKDSLRTRFTFDIGIQELGGSAVFLDHRDARLGSRESLKDMAKNLERWVDCIVARTFKQRAVDELSANCDIPVINGLTDSLHPCQGLTDLFTCFEKWGDVRGRTLCFVGDGNNTCHSLIFTATQLGAHIRVCTPEGYEPNSRVVNEAMKLATTTGSEITILNDPAEASDGVDAIYTDVWASMGQEDEIEERNGIFAPYRVTSELMGHAKPDAFFMHCLPAHRGWEVAADVMDGPQSIVYDIAENRLHVQKAIMALLIR